MAQNDISPEDSFFRDGRLWNEADNEFVDFGDPASSGRFYRNYLRGRAPLGVGSFGAGFADRDEFSQLTAEDVARDTAAAGSLIDLAGTFNVPDLFANNDLGFLLSGQPGSVNLPDFGTPKGQAGGTFGPSGGFANYGEAFDASGISDLFTSADAFRNEFTFDPLDVNDYRFDRDTVNFPDLDAFRTERMGGIAAQARAAQQQIRQDLTAGAGSAGTAANDVRIAEFMNQLGMGQKASSLESDIMERLEGREEFLLGEERVNRSLLSNIEQYNQTGGFNYAGALANFVGADERGALDAFGGINLMKLQTALAGMGAQTNLGLGSANIMTDIDPGFMPQQPIYDNAFNQWLADQGLSAAGSGGMFG